MSSSPVGRQLVRSRLAQATKSKQLRSQSLARARVSSGLSSARAANCQQTGAQLASEKVNVLEKCLVPWRAAAAAAAAAAANCFALAPHTNSFGA